MYLTSTENYKYVIYFQFLSSESTLKGTQSIDMFLRDTISLCTCTSRVSVIFVCIGGTCTSASTSVSMFSK